MAVPAEAVAFAAGVAGPGGTAEQRHVEAFVSETVVQLLYPPNLCRLRNAKSQT